MPEYIIQGLVGSTEAIVRFVPSDEYDQMDEYIYTGDAHILMGILQTKISHVTYSNLVKLMLNEVNTDALEEWKSVDG